MVPNNQKFLDNLQSAEHHIKKRLVVLGSALVMIVVVGLWAVSSSFSFSRGEGKTEAIAVRPDFSLWKSVVGGGSLIARGVGDRFHLFGNSLTVSEKSYEVAPNSN